MKRRKRITIISNYYYPDVASIANLYKQLAEFLAAKFDVTVLCSVPCYLGTIPKEYTQGKIFISNENNVRIIRLGVPEYKKEIKTSRMKNLFFFFVRSIFAYTCIGRQDIILAVSQPPVFGGLIGYCLKKIIGGKLIYNIQDFNPEQMEYSGFSKNRLLIKMLKKIDCFICRQSDAIITVSEDMRRTLYERLNSLRIPDNYVINNWVDTKRINRVSRKDNPLIEKYGLNRDDFLVVYAGNIGIMQNLMPFLLAAEELIGCSEIKFVFIGSGAWLPDMKRYVELHNLHNVTIKPYEPIENIDLVYSLGDIEIVSIGKNVTKCSMPSKTWNILACGVPLICQVDLGSELNDVINKNRIGFSVTPGDHFEIVKRIKYLYTNEEQRLMMGRNSRQLAIKEYDYKVSVQQYDDIITSMLKE